MARVYFHCSGGQRVLVDRQGSDLDDPIDIKRCAFQVAHSCIGVADEEDWRDWIVHVSDDDGEEIFRLPFTAVIGPPH